MEWNETVRTCRDPFDPKKFSNLSPEILVEWIAPYVCEQTNGKRFFYAFWWAISRKKKSRRMRFMEICLSWASILIFNRNRREKRVKFRRRSIWNVFFSFLGVSRVFGGPEESETYLVYCRINCSAASALVLFNIALRSFFKEIFATRGFSLIRYFCLLRRKNTRKRSFQWPSKEYRFIYVPRWISGEETDLWNALGF